MKLRKYLYYYLISILAVCLFSQQMFSQDRKLTLEEAVQTALENNQSLKISLMDVQKAQASVDEAFGYALPTVDFSANFTHFLKTPQMLFPDFEALFTNAVYGVMFKEKVLPEDPSKFVPMNNILQSFTPANSYEINGKITQILFNSAVFKGIGASKIYLNLSKEQVNSNVSQIILNVSKAFYGVLLTKELLEITESSYQNAQENYKNVSAMYKQGLVSEYDLLQVEVRVENIKPIIQQLKNALKSANEGLKVTIGIDPKNEIEVVGELLTDNDQLPDENNIIAKSMTENNVLKTLQVKRDVDEAFIDIDRSDYWPTVAAFGSYSYNGMGDDAFSTYSQALVGVQFSINLFRGFQTDNKVQKAQLTVKQTDEQIVQYKNYLAMQVKNKINEIRRAKEQLDASDRNIKLAQKAFDISNVRYKEGTGNQLDVKNADLELRTAKTNKLQAVYDYIVAKTELDDIQGGLIGKFQKIVEKFNYGK